MDTDAMPPWVRVLLPKVAGYIVGLVVTWLTAHGITVPPEHQPDMIVFLVAVFASVGAAVKTYLSAHMNPANVNSPKMAQQIHEEIKSAREEERNGSP